MNNKGFIATSLIYSFFLIFITLFLTIIADYLQNKVLLNTIEEGIKDTINTTKGIEDFSVADILSFQTTTNITLGGVVIPKESNWIIASKLVNETNNTLVLYSLTPDLTSPPLNDENVVKFKDIELDLSLTNDDNDTRINELKNVPGCDIINLADGTGGNAIQYTCGSNNFYRKRISLSNVSAKFNINPDGGEGAGFNITGVVS